MPRPEIVRCAAHDQIVSEIADLGAMVSGLTATQSGLLDRLSTVSQRLETLPVLTERMEALRKSLDNHEASDRGLAAAKQSGRAAVIGALVAAGASVLVAALGLLAR